MKSWASRARELQDEDIEFWKRVGLTRLRRFMQLPLPDGRHYQPQPDNEITPICHRRFESVAVEVYQELLQPLFPNGNYQNSWGENEAKQVVDRVEAYHKKAPFMLNQLKLIPDSVIKNTVKGAEFQRPKSACNFVNRLLRMAGLVIDKQQVRTGEFDPDTGKEKRIRRYSINQESLMLMRRYASSRAAHKQIGLSQIQGSSIKIRQGVTACNPDSNSMSAGDKLNRSQLGLTPELTKCSAQLVEPGIQKSPATSQTRVR